MGAHQHRASWRRPLEMVTPLAGVGVLNAQVRLKPTAMIDLYPNPELRGVAEEVEATLARIMDEAARYRATA